MSRPRTKPRPPLPLLTPEQHIRHNSQRRYDTPKPKKLRRSELIARVNLLSGRPKPAAQPAPHFTPPVSDAHREAYSYQTVLDYTDLGDE